MRNVAPYGDVGDVDDGGGRERSPAVWVRRVRRRAVVVIVIVSLRARYVFQPRHPDARRAGRGKARGNGAFCAPTRERATDASVGLPERSLPFTRRTFLGSSPRIHSWPVSL